MDSFTAPAIVIPVLLDIGYILGFVTAKLTAKLPLFSSGSSTPVSPQIVVNVPAEFKPLDTLPPTAIEGARASLWWTVYQRTVEAAAEGGYSDEVGKATDAANEAVDKVFGPAP